MGTAIYLRRSELPIVNAVLRTHGYRLVGRNEDRFVLNIIASRNIGIHDPDVARAIIAAVREHRAAELEWNRPFRRKW